MRSLTTHVHVRASMSRFYVLLAFLVLFAVLASSCSTETPADPTSQQTTNTNTGGSTSMTSIAAAYDAPPDVPTCSEGRLKESEKKKALDYLNSIRAIHGLAPVAYRSSDDVSTAKAALLIASNRSLSHDPAPSMSCWSSEGHDASGSSNLAWMSSGSSTSIPATEELVALWLRDSLNAVPGHRRWLLDPFLKYISFGRVDRLPSPGTAGITGSAMRVIYDEKQSLAGSTVEYVAYPYHDYPARLYNSGLDMSFSVLADRDDWWKNQDVDVSNASVEVRTEGGTVVPVRSLRVDNSAYGLPNNVQWRADVAPSTRYVVSIRGVKVGGVEKSYEYWFSLRTTA